MIIEKHKLIDTHTHMWWNIVFVRRLVRRDMVQYSHSRYIYFYVTFLRLCEPLNSKGEKMTLHLFEDWTWRWDSSFIKLAIYFTLIPRGVTHVCVPKYAFFCIPLSLSKTSIFTHTMGPCMVYAVHKWKIVRSLNNKHSNVLHRATWLFRSLIIGCKSFRLNHVSWKWVQSMDVWW